MISKSLIAAMGLAATVSAQTYTDCNPLKEDCPAAAALGSTVIDCDFTQGACDGISFVPGTNSDQVSYGTDQGARFRILNGKQAPTVASDKYIFFGRVEVVCQAAVGQGVITAIVLQSQNLDEVDWEWIGGKNSEVQTNYFGKGDTSSYGRGGYHEVTEPLTTMHTYTFEWTAEKLEWLLDGEVIRTLTYEEAEGGQFYPQTPSQIKLGTWVGGLPGNSQGTIDWAGGETNFDDAPFDAFYKSIKIIDYAGGNSAPTESIREYVYGDRSGDWESIEVIKGEPIVSSSSSSSSSAASTKTADQSSSAAASDDVSATATATSAADSTKTEASDLPEETGTKTASETATETEDSESDSPTDSKTHGTKTATDDAEATATATASEELSTTSTIYATQTHTVTSCAPTVTDCPADESDIATLPESQKTTVVVTETVPVSTTVCPITETDAEELPGTTEAPITTTYDSTSTIFTTSVHTVTECPEDVTDCPVGTVTETISVSVTVCPVTETIVPPPAETGHDEVPDEDEDDEEEGNSPQQPEQPEQPEEDDDEEEDNSPQEPQPPSCGPGTPNCHVPQEPQQPEEPEHTPEQPEEDDDEEEDNSPQQPEQPTHTPGDGAHPPAPVPTSATLITSTAVPVPTHPSNGTTPVPPMPTTGAASSLGGAMGMAVGVAAMVVMLA